MAPTYKCVIISFLVVISVVAPNLPPSTAIRSSQGADPEATVAAAGKSSHAVAAALAPAPRGAPTQQLEYFLTPDFPCFPFLPKPLLDLCRALFPPPTPSPPAPPEPTECRSPLKKMLVPSCAGFLTDSGVSAPSSDCCRGVRFFFGDDSTTPFCLCHVANGDIRQLLPAPVANQTREVDVLVACDVGLTAEKIATFCDKDNKTFRDLVPPMDPPSSPPPALGKKA